MPIITIPKPLREKLGDEGGESLVDVFREWERGTKEDVIALSEEKFKRRLVEETTKLDKRITEEMSKLDKRITEEVSSPRGELLERIDRTSAGL
jgi:bifunctional DNA-binding transcriptional regulator/antitoxin component of YhaV-PrlF toxin-antitoxin module